MAFFIHSFIAITDKSLRYFHSDHGKDWNFNFPENSTLYNEVLDEEILTHSFSQFLQTHNSSKQKVCIILPEGMIYHKQITENDPQKIESAEKEFLSYIPFDNTKMTHCRITNEGITHIFALCSPLVSLLLTTLEKHGYKVEAIVAAEMLGLSIEQQLSQEDAKKIFENTTTIQQYNCLKPFIQTPVITEQKHEQTIDNEKRIKKNPSKKQISILVTSMILLFSVTGFALIRSSTNSQKFFLSFSGEEKEKVVKPRHSPTPLATPTITYKNKADITIEIISGPFTSWQAPSVKDSLNTNGYPLITTTTDREMIATQAALIHQLAISEPTIASIAAVLRNSFKDLVIKQATDSATADIVIITGN